MRSNFRCSTSAPHDQTTGVGIYELVVHEVCLLGGLGHSVTFCDDARGDRDAAAEPVGATCFSSARLLVLGAELQAKWSMAMTSMAQNWHTLFHVRPAHEAHVVLSATVRLLVV